MVIAFILAAWFVLALVGGSILGRAIHHADDVAHDQRAVMSRSHLRHAA